MASSVGCSSLGPVWWDAGRLYHLIISEVISAVSCGLLDSFIHSTFINILMVPTSQKVFAPGSEGYCKHFLKDTPVLFPFVSGQWSRGWEWRPTAGVWEWKMRGVDDTMVNIQPSPTHSSILHLSSEIEHHLSTISHFWHLLQSALQSDKLYLSTYLISPTSWMVKHAR